MNKMITHDNLRKFAYVNETVCKKPIRGIVLDFMGLGGQMMYANDTDEGQYFGEKGILFVVPYNNPWCWMNPQAVAYTDEIIDVLMAAYGLPEDLPIVSTGRSMGGLSSLVYMVRAKRTPVACVANCPVCDAVYHFAEREDLPRTMYSALYGIAGDLETALRAISPLHLVDEMPDARYEIFHCGQDQAVNLQMHTERFVVAMQQSGHRVNLTVIPGRGHCDLTLEAKRQFWACVEAAIPV